MTRDAENPNKESSDHYFEGHLYNFKVEKSFTGTSKKDILVNIPYQESYPYKNKDNKETSFDVIDPYYVKPETGSEYILFLKKDEMFGNYYGAIQPFQIKINDNEQIKLVTNQIIDNHLPENAEMDENSIHFKTTKEFENEKIELITEVSKIENFIQDYDLNQLENEIIKLSK